MITNYCFLLSCGGSICGNRFMLRRWSSGSFLLLSDLLHRARRVFVPGVAIVNVINAAHCRRRVRSTESGVLNQRDEGNLRFVCWCVTDEPRVVLVLASIFAEPNDLRRTGLA